jgi:hypothetical protein
VLSSSVAQFGFARSQRTPADCAVGHAPTLHIEGTDQEKIKSPGRAARVKQQQHRKRSCPGRSFGSIRRRVARNIPYPTGV